MRRRLRQPSFGDPMIGRHSLPYAKCSTRGRRAVNEDRAVAVGRNGTYVLAVADGMGGAVAGDVAADAAMRAFLRTMRGSRLDDVRDSLCAAFEAADAAVRAATTPAREGMGTTLVSAVARGLEIWVGNIGDSRAVLVLPEEIVRLSSDHSLVEEELRGGRMTELEALQSRERHVLSRALGAGDAEPDLTHYSLQEDPVVTKGLLLIGSDGLFNFVGDSELLEIAADETRAGVVSERLVRRAIENGSDDNVSAAVLMLDGRQRRRHVSAWVAAILIFLAVATVAYSVRRVVVDRITAPHDGFAHRLKPSAWQR